MQTPSASDSAGPQTAERAGHAPRLWFDVEDIADYFAGYSNPSGIQRVTIELLELAHERAGERVRFCRVSAITGYVEALDFAQVEAIWSGPPARSLAGKIRRRLDHHMRRPVFDRLAGARRESAFAKEAAPGDVIVCLGSPLDGGYGASLTRLKRRYGVRHALLIHDILYVTHPEMFDASLQRALQSWLPAALGAADLVFTSSDYCRDELLGYGRRSGLTLPSVERIRFGAGFRKDASAPAETQPAFPDRFALYVSTLETRKNHGLLVRVWKTLLDRHGRDAIPALVLVGRAGRGAHGLMKELQASRFLGGKIVLHEHLPDAAVQRAYRDCMFTLYPSLCEGWGLPVTESLVNGRFCIASNRTAIPEAGGEFVDYVDPESENETLAAIQRVLFEPGYLERRTDQIVRHYQPPSWATCFRDLEGAIDRRLATPGGHGAVEQAGSRGRRPFGAIGRDLDRALRRFRHARPGSVASGLVRAVALRLREPARAPAETREERIVVTLTTTPDRLSHIVPVLRSLADQTRPADRIVLALPARSRRTGAAYPAPPSLPESVEILACEDEGPATKLLPALRAEPAAAIIVADDDVIYPKDFIETLLRAHRRRPKAALGYRGWKLEAGVDPRDYDHVFATAVRAAERVDVLLGTWGYLIPPGALDDAIFSFDGYPSEVRWVDDVWVSGHLARRGIERLVVPARSFPLETRASFVSALTDTVNRSGRNDAIAIAAFADWWGRQA